MTQAVPSLPHCKPRGRRKTLFGLFAGRAARGLPTPIVFDSIRTAQHCAFPARPTQRVARRSGIGMPVFLARTLWQSFASRIEEIFRNGARTSHRPRTKAKSVWCKGTSHLGAGSITRGHFSVPAPCYAGPRTVRLTSDSLHRKSDKDYVAHGESRKTADEHNRAP